MGGNEPRGARAAKAKHQPATLVGGRNVEAAAGRPPGTGRKTGQPPPPPARPANPVAAANVIDAQPAHRPAQGTVPHPDTGVDREAGGWWTCPFENCQYHKDKAGAAGFYNEQCLIVHMLKEHPDEPGCDASSLYKGYPACPLLATAYNKASRPACKHEAIVWHPLPDHYRGLRICRVCFSATAMTVLKKLQDKQTVRREIKLIWFPTVDDWAEHKNKATTYKGNHRKDEPMTLGDIVDAMNKDPAYAAIKQKGFSLLAPTGLVVFAAPSKQHHQQQLGVSGACAGTESQGCSGAVSRLSYLPGLEPRTGAASFGERPSTSAAASFDERFATEDAGDGGVNSDARDDAEAQACLHGDAGLGALAQLADAAWAADAAAHKAIQDHALVAHAARAATAAADGTSGAAIGTSGATHGISRAGTGTSRQGAGTSGAAAGTSSAAAGTSSAAAGTSSAAAGSSGAAAGSSGAAAGSSGAAAGTSSAAAGTSSAAAGTSSAAAGSSGAAAGSSGAAAGSSGAAAGSSGAAAGSAGAAAGTSGAAAGSSGATAGTSDAAAGASGAAAGSSGTAAGAYGATALLAASAPFAPGGSGTSRHQLTMPVAPVTPHGGQAGASTSGGATRAIPPAPQPQPFGIADIEAAGKVLASHMRLVDKSQHLEPGNIRFARSFLTSDDVKRLLGNDIALDDLLVTLPIMLNDLHTMLSGGHKTYTETGNASATRNLITTANLYEGEARDLERFVNNMLLPAHAAIDKAHTNIANLLQQAQLRIRDLRVEVAHNRHMASYQEYKSSEALAMTHSTVTKLFNGPYKQACVNAGVEVPYTVTEVLGQLAAMKVPAPADHPGDKTPLKDAGDLGNKQPLKRLREVLGDVIREYSGAEVIKVRKLGQEKYEVDDVTITMAPEETRVPATETQDLIRGTEEVEGRRMDMQEGEGDTGSVMCL